MGRTPATEATLTTDPCAARKAGSAATVMAQVAEHVDFEDAPPHVDGRRLHVVVRDHGGGPGIVHEGIEATPTLEGGLHEVPGDLRLRDVALDVERIGQ